MRPSVETGCIERERRRSGCRAKGFRRRNPKIRQAETPVWSPTVKKINTERGNGVKVNSIYTYTYIYIYISIDVIDIDKERVLGDGPQLQNKENRERG